MRSRRYLVDAISICLMIGSILTFCVDASAGINDGLVAYYPFNGDAVDATGNGHDGDEYGVTPTEDRFGNSSSAYNFDGMNDQYIEVPHSADLNLVDEFTISLWVNFHSFQAGAANAIIDKCDWSPDEGYYISYSSIHGITLAINDDSYRHYSNYHPNFNEWVHIVATYEQTTGVTELYINGSSIGTQSLAPTLASTTKPLKIGQVNHQDYGTDGAIDDIRIYNRVLSENEIRDLYSLVGHWKFDGDTIDSSVHGNDGTASGNPSYADGVCGVAMDFDGDGDCVDTGFGNGESYSALSYNLWVKSVEENTGWGVSNGGNFIAVFSPVAGDDGRLRIYGRGLNETTIGQLVVTVKDDIYYGTVRYDDGNWHMLSLTFLDGAWNFYVDANLIASDSVTGNILPDTNFTIGCRTYDQNEDVKAIIDDVRIYNHALSQTEIQTLMSECQPDFAPVPQTGQTISHATGDDGDLQTGVALSIPRFADNTDGTITDNSTGLMWVEDADLPAGTKTWQDALDYIAGMNDGTYSNFGYTDWRLPNVFELQSLIDYGETDPVITSGNPFNNIQFASSTYYWSGTTYEGDSGHAWVIPMKNGGIYHHPKTESKYLWAVRGSSHFASVPIPKTGQISAYSTGDDGDLEKGITWPEQRFTDNDDSTVTDKLTGLIWAKDANLAVNDSNWQGALDYVAGMNDGTYSNFGYTDWRLPNVRELHSLVDYGDNSPTQPSEQFDNVVSDNYWSSTTSAAATGSGYRINIGSGIVDAGSKSDDGYLWPVRGGGLVGHWKFDEGSGSIAYDSSGYGNDGIQNGDPNYTPNDTCGDALSFDGEDDYIRMPRTESLEPSDSITVSLWFKANETNVAVQRIISKGYDGNSHSITVYIENNKLYAWVRGTSTPITHPRIDPFTDTLSWHHLCLSYDGSLTKLYLDSVLADSYPMSGSIVYDSTDWAIGNQVSTNQYFNGLIDEVRIYNKALSQSEIQADMNACAPVENPLPDTGQTKCYDNSIEITCPQSGQQFYGQDAQYTTNSQSYTKLDQNGDDLPPTATSWVMVRDNVTGLIWEVKTDDGSIHDEDNRYTWQNAQDIFIDDLNTNSFGGYSDWRLPTAKELATIVDSSISSPNPTINTTYFPNTATNYYWSSTTCAYDAGAAWVVGFVLGDVQGGGKNSSDMPYVRAVRGEQASNNFIDNEDGTITDTSTGLMWEIKTDDGGDRDQDNTYTWQQALSYCESLLLAGYSDWRLPNRNELQSIVDYNSYAPSIDPIFSHTKTSYYWSSTTETSNPSLTWVIDFSLSRLNFYGKTDEGRYVRAVRGGLSGTVEPDCEVDADCADGLYCNGDETCNTATGVCEPGTNPCPETECNHCQEDTDSCFDPAATPCADDGNVCTDDECDGTGSCTHPNNTDPCDDLIACTDVDTCADGACNGTPNNTLCADGNICTDDICTVGVGCSNTNNSASCDDGLYCNGTDTCGGGSCSVHAGDPCTGGAECNSSCQEITDTCFDTAGTACPDDGNVCTDDECDGAGSCAHPNNTAPCDDGQFCNGLDTCSGGFCSFHAGDPCPDDGLYCNGFESCDEGIDQCVSNGSPCLESECNHCQEDLDSCFDPTGTGCLNDGNACTNDICNGLGVCMHPDHPEGTACADDGNDCTDDLCDGSGVCTHPDLAAGTPCGNPAATECTDSDTCDGSGACQANHANAGTLCGDSLDDDCTDPDTCNGSGTCMDNHESNGIPCSDGDFCNGLETCLDGLCELGTDPCAPLLCDGGVEECYCDANEQCDDGYFCNGDETCVGDTCEAGTNPCSLPKPVCDEDTDTCVVCLNDGDCSNELYCDGMETCVDNVCQTGIEPCLDNGQFCDGSEDCDENTDSCISTGDPCIDPPECREEDDTCVDCLTDADCNDGNPCTTDTCILENNTCDNPWVVNGTACADGLWCNGNETCTDGECGEGVDPCPEQSCDETTHQCVTLTAIITKPEEDPLTSNHGEIIAFEGQTAPAGVTIDEYKWSFSDDPDSLAIATEKSFSTSLLQVGEHTIYFKAMDAKDIWSNTASVTVNVLDAIEDPDLALTRSDITFLDAEGLEVLQIDSGEHITLRARIHNVGLGDTQQSSPVTVSFYEGEVGGNLIHSEVISEVIESDPTGGEETAKIVEYDWLPTGDEYKIITVTVSYSEHEANYQNNTASSFIKVGDPAGTYTILVDGGVSKSQPCCGETITVSGIATYNWVADFPVMGARVTVEVREENEAGYLHVVKQGRTISPTGHYSLSFTVPSSSEPTTYLVITKVNDAHVIGLDNDLFTAYPCGSTGEPGDPEDPETEIYDLSCGSISFSDDIFYIPCAGFNNTKTYVNSLVDISGQLTNAGNQDFEHLGFSVEFHSGYPFTPENLICSEVIAAGTIEIGESIPISCEDWESSSAGTYNIWMTAEGLVDGNNNNNKASRPIQVYDRLPDLRPFYYSGCSRISAISFSEEKIVQGDTITITSNIYNKGDVTSGGPFTVEIYHGDPYNGGVLIDDDVLNNIPAGGQGWIEIDWNTSVDVPVGYNTICVRTDTQDNVLEYDEFNNETCTQVYVYPSTCDLHPTSVTVSNYAPEPDELIDITCSLENKGGGACDSEDYVVFYNGNPDSGGIPIDPILTPIIPPFGNDQVILYDWPVPTPPNLPYSYTLYAKIASNGRKTHRSITLYGAAVDPPPDLRVYSVDICGPRVIDPGTAINFSSRVCNDSSTTSAENAVAFFYVTGETEPELVCAVDIPLISPSDCTEPCEVQCENSWITEIEGMYVIDVWVEPSYSQGDANLDNNDGTTSFGVGICEADFTCDMDVDGEDMTAFLTHFGRGQYSNPCTNDSQCHGDFTCDADVDAEDVTTFLDDFGRGQYNNPCPPCEEGEWCSY